MTNATVSDDYEGRYISTNWGYNQTNREFAKIIEVSDIGKTVAAQLVETETVKGEPISDRVYRNEPPIDDIKAWCWVDGCDNKASGSGCAACGAPLCHMCLETRAGFCNRDDCDEGENTGN